MGEIHEPHVTQSVSPQNDASALEAIKHWKFLPTQKDGKLQLRFARRLGLCYSIDSGRFPIQVQNGNAVPTAIFPMAVKNGSRSLGVPRLTFHTLGVISEYVSSPFLSSESGLDNN